jgi:hypothetical protein
MDHHIRRVHLGNLLKCTCFCFQEIEDHLHEEENKVNVLNKAKAKLERDLDEVSARKWIFFK